VNRHLANQTNQHFTHIFLSGLSYSHLKELYLKFGTKGLLAILSMPPSQSTATKPRVTRTKRILDAIANHFQETFPKEE
jgi:glutathione peroxidase-family protein